MSGDPLILVHLSDIHFRQPAHGDAYDLDAPLRAALESNAIAVSREVGTPHAILVTGDIAFSGKREEYQDASTWLENLCENIGCEPVQVWCVPGNHDVDRQVILGDRSLRDARANLRKCDLTAIDSEMEDYLYKPRVFYEPMEAYNEFAARFQCPLTKEAPVWHTDFMLNDGTVLKLHGFNSVLISDNLDDNAGHKLVLGRHQYSGLTAQDGVEHMVLCHHPPDWLREQDEVETALTASARIHLFGHKHWQRLTQINRALRISAGAVGHCQREPAWDPRYNWITIRVVPSPSGGREMEVCVFPKVWNRETRAFGTDYNSAGGRDYRTFRLPLPVVVSRRPPVVRGPVGHSSAEPRVEQAGPALEEADVLDNPITDPARVLAHRYFGLDYVKKMQIADKLSLYDDSDANLGGVELFLKHLERAKDHGQLKELWDVVEALHGDNKYPDNPYASETRKG